MSPPISRPARPGCVLVVDVSKWQGPTPPWQAMRDAGAVGAIVKATEGKTYTNPFYARQVRDAAERSLMVSSYHYFRPQHKDPEAQARRFCDVAFDRSMLFPGFDLEETDGQPGEVVVERSLRFLEETERLWRKLPRVYTGSGFITGLSVAPAVLAPLGAYPLWLADYRDEPHVMAPWKAWESWQWTDGAKARIAPVALDLSWFRGTEIDLALAGASS